MDLPAPNSREANRPNIVTLNEGSSGTRSHLDTLGLAAHWEKVLMTGLYGPLL